MEELESLVVRLIGDTSNFSTNMEKAADDAKKAADGVEQAGNKIESMANSLMGFARNAASALAGMGIKHWLDEAKAAYGEEATAIRKLGIAIENNEGDVKSLVPAYQEWASWIQKVTTVADDQALSMLQMAETYGITGDAAKRAVQNAIALAAAKGGEASNYIRATAALEQGTSTMLGRHLPALRKIEDDTERAAKAQELLNKMFKVAESDAKTSGGQMKQLANIYGDFMEEIGKVVAEGMKPMVEITRQVVTWLSELSPEMKQVIAVGAGVLAFFFSLGPAIAAISFFGPIVFNPVTLAITAVVGAVALLVQSLGGLTAVWNMLKSAGTTAWNAITSTAMAFWQEVQPIWLALEGLAISVWTNISSVAITAWETIIAVVVPYIEMLKTAFNTAMDWISKKSGSVWTSVKDTATTSMIDMEFATKNFGDTWKVASLSAQYSFVKFANILIHFFTSTIPATFSWFKENWQTIFLDMFNYTTTVISNLASNIVSIIKNIPGLIRGKVKFSELWKPLSEGFVAETKKLELPEREIGELEAQLGKELDEAAEDYGSKLGEFRAKRLAEIDKASQPVAEADKKKAKDDAMKLGTDIGANLGKGTKEALGKFDAALTGSVEAMGRFMEFRDKILSDPKTGEMQGKSKSSGPELKRFDAAQTGSVEARDRMDKTENLLTQIRDSLREKGPSLEIGEAGVA